MKTISFHLLVIGAACLMQSACSGRSADDYSPLIPAEEFTTAVKQGRSTDYSYFRANLRRNTDAGAKDAKQRAEGKIPATGAADKLNRPDLNGLALRRSFEQEPTVADVNSNVKNEKYALIADHGNTASPVISPVIGQEGLTPPAQSQTPPPTAALGSLSGGQFAGQMTGQMAGLANNQVPPQYLPAPPPPGSFAPYYTGQMRSNPSLWPDEAQGSMLFRDHRAFQAMDVVTIVVNENTTGKKKAETGSESKYGLTAGIANFFGIETKKWKANNTGLDPEALIGAETETNFDGKGETTRTGTLRGQISAVIMETLPNGLLRIEGTKIVSINAEEEVMVVSGLVRPIDVSADNQVDSRRIANMRIDFYGQGVLGENQAPGWGARFFNWVWPF